MADIGMTMHQFVVYRDDGNICAVIRSEHEPDDMVRQNILTTEPDEDLLQDPERYIVVDNQVRLRTPMEVCIRARELYNRTISGETKKGEYLDKHKVLFTDKEWGKLEPVAVMGPSGGGGGDNEKRIAELERKMNLLLEAFK